MFSLFKKLRGKSPRAVMVRGSQEAHLSFMEKTHAWVRLDKKPQHFGMIPALQKIYCPARNARRNGRVFQRRWMDMRLQNSSRSFAPKIQRAQNIQVERKRDNNLLLTSPHGKYLLKTDSAAQLDISHGWISTGYGLRIKAPVITFKNAISGAVNLSFGLKSV